MKIDFNKGAYIQISGELGKYNSIPVDLLVKFAQDLQKLIQTIARYDLPSDEPIDLNNFKIELVDFKKGSAVPKFAFSSRVENTSGQNWQIHRNSVNERFEKLIELSDRSDFTELRVLYPEPFKRNLIVQDLYDFSNDFGNSPVSFIDYDDKQGKVVSIFKINKFKSSTKNELITEIKESLPVPVESGVGAAKIKYSTKGGITKKNIIDYYTGKNISLEFAPEVIVAKNRKYVLKYPLRCLFEKEDDYYVIQSEMLNIIGTGLTEDDAEKAFADEFDFVFQRFNTLNDDSLTNHNKLVKTILNQIIENIE